MKTVRNILKMAGIGLCLFLATEVFLSSCSNEDTNTPVMTGLTLRLKNASHILYSKTPRISKDDLVLTAIYDDKTQKDVTNNAEYNVSFPFYLTGEDTSITATYAETKSKKTATLKITTKFPDENNGFQTGDENEGYDAKSGIAPSRNILTADGSEIVKMDKSLYHLLTESGIGYGYDVIKSPYYDSSEKTREMILDAEKLEIDYIVKVKNKENTVTGETTGSNQEEYIHKNAKNLEIPLNLKVDGKKIPLFSTSLAFTMSDNEKTEIKKKSNTLFYTYFDYRYPFYYQLIDIPLVDYLSEEFTNTVEGKTPPAKTYFELKDWTGLAKYIFEHYGTHIITGVQYGGRYEYMYCAASNDFSALESIKNGLGFNFKLEIDNIGKTDTNIKYNTEVYETLSRSDMFKTFTLRIHGGDPYLDTSPITFNDTKNMKSVHSKWINSMSNEEVAVGLTNYGFTGIWNIIPESENSEDIKEALERLFNGLAVKTYEETLKK